MAHSRQERRTATKTRQRRFSVVEVLEPRVLYSADSMASLLPLLLPDELNNFETDAALLLFDEQSPIAENDLLPDQVLNADLIMHMVFIDSAIPEFRTLEMSAVSATTSVVVIDSNENGLSVISETLEKYSSLESVQIISHGASGQLWLGKQSVDEQALLQEQLALSQWSNALSEGGDILLLGCDVAAGDAGRSFVQQLALLTGADVAASDDLTGHGELHANWDLEVTSGAIEAVVQLDSKIQSGWSYTLGNIEVDTTSDKFSTAIQSNWDVGSLISYRSANPGFEVSLREALYVAQNLPDNDVITLPGGVFNLTLSSGDADGKWGDLNVAEDTTIIGEDNPINPTVLNQDVVNNRIITASAGTLQLESVTIADADSSHIGGGGAIYSAGSVVLRDTILQNNRSGENGGAVATGGDLTLLRTQVLNNSSDKLGGALYADGELTVDESQFTGNSALDDGGAIYAHDNQLIIRDSGFTRNFTDTADASGMSGNGGAVAGTASMEIVRSSFDDNETRNVNLLSTGGAVHHESSGTISISDVTFSGNSSVSGGALYTDQSASISNATFVDNEAIINGAAIQSDGGIVSIGSSIFSGNQFTNALTAGSTHIVTDPQFTVAGNVASDGFNLFDFDPTPQVILSTADIVNTAIGSVSAQLEEISELVVGSGNYVKVHALNEGSQAINAGKVPVAGAEDAQGRSRDQVADIGASEYDSASSIIYWADAGGGIYRSDTDFANVQQIVFGATNPDSIVVDEDSSKLYWLTNGNGSSNIDLVSASLDGVGGESTLLSNLAAASGLALNSAAGHLYVAFSGNAARIDRYDIQDLLAVPVTVVANNAGNTTAIKQNEVVLNPERIVFNSSTEQLFWSETGSGSEPSSIRMFDVAANSVEIMVIATADSIAVNPEGTSVFWTDRSADTIGEFDSDSAQATQTQVALTDVNPTAIAYANAEDLLIWTADAATSISAISADDKTLQSRYVHDSILSDIATLRTSTVTAIPAITTNSDMSVPEGSSRLLPKTSLIATDPDTDSIDVVYTVTQTPVHGYLTLSGNLTSTFTQQDLEGDLVNYVHDGSETTSDSIEFQLSDGIHSSDRFKYNIRITPVNDAPSLSVATDGSGFPVSMPLQEAGSYIFDPAVLIGFDIESTQDSLVYLVTSELNAGIITIDAVEVPVISENGVDSVRFTGAQLAAGQVRFVHDGSENAPDNLTIKVDDGTSSDSESGSVTMNFDYVAVNDPPILTTSAISVFENDSVQLTNQNLIVEDPDLGFGNVVYSLSEMPTHGTVEVLERGPLLSTAGTFTQVELNNGLLYYTPNVNNAGDVTYQLVFVATDPEGGVSVPVSMDVLVTGMNNTPSLTLFPLDIEEGGQVVLSSNDIVVSDPDSSSVELILSYSDTDELNGSLFIANQPIEVASDGFRYFSYQDLISGAVVYMHDGSEEDKAEIRLRVGDGISTSEEFVLSLNVTPINDVPLLSLPNNAISVDEGGQYVFLPTDFSYTDADAEFSQMRMFFTPNDSNVGKISVAGSSASSFTLTELADGQVVYTHDGSEPDITGNTDGFSFRVTDGELESLQVALSMSIAPQNDLPVFEFISTGEAISENIPGQVVGQISYTDADAGDIVAFSVSDDRFVVTPVGENSMQVALREEEVLDFELDSGFEPGEMRLEFTAIDSNPDVVRPIGYQGTQQEGSLSIKDMNDAPVVNVSAVATAVLGAGYTFDSNWVTDQDHGIAELVFTASMVDGSELPTWLEFRSETRSFEVTDPESTELTDIDVVMRIVDAAGGAASVPISLLFDSLIDPAPAEPVVEPAPIEEDILSEVVASSVEPTENENLTALITVPITTPEFTEVVVLNQINEESETDVQSRKSVGTEILSYDINQDVDVHDLIKPLASIGTLELAVVDTAIRASSSGSSTSVILQDMDINNLQDIFNASQAELDAQSALLADAMDSKDVLKNNSSAVSRALFGTSTGLSTGLSVGYLLWLVRGGTLMGSMLSSLPAWRFVDPLPVLGSLADDMENDEETLESIVSTGRDGVADNEVAAAPTLVTRFANMFSRKG